MAHRRPRHRPCPHGSCRRAAERHAGPRRHDDADRRQRTRSDRRLANAGVAGRDIPLRGLVAAAWKTYQGSGWEARAEARTTDGRVVGAAEAMCTRDERTWKNRDEFAIRSMAQTRAMSKALRGPLGFVITLAGRASTPAEEMPSEAPASDPPLGGADRPRSGQPVPGQSRADNDRHRGRRTGRRGVRRGAKFGQVLRRRDTRRGGPAGPPAGAGQRPGRTGRFGPPRGRRLTAEIWPRDTDHQARAFRTDPKN